jgi:hypothetical protein
MNMNNKINQVKSIVKASVNVLTGLDEETSKLRERRLTVCQYCSLFSEVKTRSYCDSSKALHNVTKQVISTSSPLYNTQEYSKGCGCTLNNKGSSLPEKTTVIGSYNTCPTNKWDKVERELFMYLGKLESQVPTDYISKNKVRVNIRLVDSKDLIELGFTKNILTITVNDKQFILQVQFKEDHTLLTINDTEVLKGNITKKDIQLIIDATHNLKSNEN